MADVWTVEVTVDGVTIASPGPSAVNSGVGAELHQLTLSVEDGTAAGNTIVLEWGMEVHSFGGGPTYEYRSYAWLYANRSDATRTSHHIPQDGPFNSFPGAAVVATQVEADGQNGAAFLAGGKLMLTKDDNTSQITMETPLGTSTVSFATALQTIGHRWKGDSLYHRWTRPIPSTADGGSKAFWAGFWTTKNGTRVSGAALGTNQPGDWDNNAVGEAPWYFNTVLGTRIARDNSETATRISSGWIYTDATDNPRSTVSDEWRFWNNTGSIGEVPLVLDLCTNRKSGQILVARVKKQTPERITISSTEDSGANWTEYEVDAGIGNFCSPPTLGVTPDGAFSLVFHDGTLALYYRSETGGRTWDFISAFTPVLGTLRVPAHFQHPSGLVLVTYTQGGDFKYASFEASAGAGTAIALATLATGTANVYPAFLILPKGGIVIAWADLTTKTQQRSDNLVTFSADFTGAASSERRPRHICHPENGLTLHLYQDTGNLLFYPSEDGGLTVLHPPATTIFAGAADQIADIEVTPIGLLIVVFQSYDPPNDNWDLTTYGSDDLGSSWVAI